MSTTIAIAGKGGTGKTTVSAMLIRTLVERGMTPLLAVDADPNSNLGDALGLAADTSIGELQADTLKIVNDLPAGVPLSRHLEYELHQAIVEGEGFDVLAMGHGEGPGCYCAVNHILRRYLETLRRSYRFTVLDNEAGMEHLSRRVSHGIDALLIVSDPSPAALRAARRITKIADDLELQIGRRFLVLNNLRGELPERTVTEIAGTELEIIGEIPYDEEVYEMNQIGRPISDLSAKAPALTCVAGLLDTLLEKEEDR